MKGLTSVIAAVVLLFVLPTVTQATSVLGNAPIGPIVIKYTNYDVGALYHVTNNTYTGSGTLDGLSQTPPPGGLPGEDGWTIFRVDSISDISQTISYYNRFTSDVEITGILFGEQDTYLKQTGTGSTLTQDIHGTGVYAAFFEDPSKNFDPTGGPTARNPDGTYPTATDGQLIWTFASVPGWDASFPTDEYFSTFRPNATLGDTSANGGMFGELSSVPGFGTGSLNGLLNPNGIAPGVAARLDFTGRIGTNGWITTSDDPVLVSVIPEPMTMAMLGMALVGLGGYVTKRRKSVDLAA